MIEQIGDAAGKVWLCLKKNGEMTYTRLGNTSKIPRSLLDRSLGWLAREDKIRFRKDQRSLLISLTPE